MHGNDTEQSVTANGRRRDGGGPDVFRTAAPASATSSMTHHPAIRKDTTVTTESPSTTAELLTVVAEQVARATLAAADRIRNTPRPAAPTATKPVARATPPKRPLTVADLTARQRQHLEVCVHEAGHAVAGVVLGAQLRSAVVFDSRATGIEGLTSFSDRPYGRDEEIAYAGPWAQARWRAGGRRPTQREMFAVLDGDGHRDCGVLTAAGGTHLGHAVQPIIERAWPAVIRVAKRLHRAGETSHSDVCEALGLTDDGGPGSSQLAGLRAGMRPVPPLT